MTTPKPEVEQLWRVRVRRNLRPLVGSCELCGCHMIASIPSAFFYEFDDSAFPVCVSCAVNYGVRIPAS